MSQQRNPQSTENADFPISVEIRHATVADAANIWQLVTDCRALDKNSCYAYLLLCRDFSDTCLVAHSEGNLLGFVTAYIPPSRPDAVFVWQIGTAPAARKKGVGKALLRALLKTPACRELQFLEATVTPSNTASLRLFRSIAEELQTAFRLSPAFESSDFGPLEEASNPHEPENLVRITLINE